jgi:hypothetical protein
MLYDQLPPGVLSQLMQQQGGQPNPALAASGPPALAPPGTDPGMGQNQGPQMARPDAANAPDITPNMGAIDTSAASMKADNPRSHGMFGWLHNIQDKPGGRQALMALANGLLSHQNFFEGLGAGGLAYQKTLDTEADKYKPTLVDNGNFEATRSEDDDSLSYKQTPIAAYNTDTLQTKLLAAQANNKYRTDSMVDMNGRKIDAQYDWNADANDVKRYGIEADARQAAANRENAMAIAQLRASTDLTAAKMSAGQKMPQPQIIKQVSDYQHLATVNQTTAAHAGPILEALNSGKLPLDPVSVLRYKAALATGIGMDEKAALYGDLQQYQQQLVNSILLDNKGVQTEGDAQRARLQIAVASGDPKAVAREIGTSLDGINRASSFYKAKASDISRQYGVDSPDTNSTLGIPNPAPAPAPAPARASGGGAAKKTSTGVSWRIVN